MIKTWGIASGPTSRAPLHETLPTGARPRTRVPASARTEAPQRPSEEITEDLSHKDAFQELIALSKRQSVNRKQDVRRNPLFEVMFLPSKDRNASNQQIGHRQ